MLVDYSNKVNLSTYNTCIGLVFSFGGLINLANSVDVTFDAFTHLHVHVTMHPST